MNIDRAALQALITERIPDLVELVIKGLEATDTHGRGSTAALCIKVTHDADDENLIHVEAATKAKRPRSRGQDVCDLPDFSVIIDYKTDEAQGQMRISEAV